MLVPFQFRELDTAQALPSVDENPGDFEALPISKSFKSEWQSLDFQPLHPPGGDGASAIIQDAGESGPESTPEAAPQTGFEIREPAPIIDKARLDALEQEARDKGYADGFTAGREAGLAAGVESAAQQSDAERQELKALQQGLLGVEADFFKAIKTDLIRLLQIVPRRIIGKELSLRPEAIVEMAENLLSAFATQRSLTLRANPEDARLLEEIVMTSANEDESRLTILSDPTLKRADLRLITESGEIDASIETQLARYDKQVEAWISGSHDDNAKGNEGIQ